MRTISTLLGIGLMLALCSCGSDRGATGPIVVLSDTLSSGSDSVARARAANRKRVEESHLADSLRLAQVMKEALAFATEHVAEDTFSRRYEVLLDGVPMSVEIRSAYFFTKQFPHLMIRLQEPNAIHIDIHSRANGRFEQVVSHEEWSMTYVNDTIRDINGDGLADLVVNWYAVTGCCLKAFSDVYLLRADRKAFYAPFEFINPTFAPHEHIVRGVCYGHPGETEMYKFKWNHERIDTVEYVHFETDSNSIRTGKILVSNKAPFSPDFRILRRLDRVPTEYRKINGYDWFTGEIYE
ncbi:MAG TPA: hypothetical protein VGE21_14510 [Flavobacteriales bacterium]